VTSARPLRVAIVAPYDLSAAGGINNQIRAQARALRRLGHAVEVAGSASGWLAAGERSLGRTFPVTFGGTESGFGVDPRAFAAAGRLLREPFDIVHVHEPLMPLVPWIVLMRSRAPLVGTFHVHREEGHRLYASTAWALQPLARRLRARVAVSEAARRTVAPHFPGAYEIVPNGIEVDRFRIAQPRPPGWRRDRRHVLYVGRLEPRKGVEHLVRAMAQVHRQAPDVTLAIVGDGSERMRLTHLSHELGVPVQFAGRVTDEALPAYLQAADVVCSPALGGESFGIVLLEAMACAKPIVASRIEGYEALVGGSECAALVPPGDADALATALLALLESADRRRALGERGVALVRDYEWAVIAPRLVSIYQRVLQETTGSTPGSSRSDTTSQ
jgi:phosphatidyl-myo-inositol alpha-mannosyltransferase